MSHRPGCGEAYWTLRLDGLSVAAKLTLMRLVSKANFADQDVLEPVCVYAPAKPGASASDALCEHLADLTGQTSRAIRRHLTVLRKLGLIRTSGRMVELIPLPVAEDLTEGGQPQTVTDCPQTVTPCPKTADRERSEVDRKRSGFDRERSEVDRKRSLHINPASPPLSPHSPEAADRERELAARHAKLEAERAANRARDRQEREAGGDLSAEISAAVNAANAGAWCMDLMRSTWARQLAEAVRSLSLTPAQVTGVLEAWTRESAEGKAGRGEIPGRLRIWSSWSTDREWLTKTIAGLDRDRRPPRRPLSLLSASSFDDPDFDDPECDFILGEFSS